MDVIMERGGRLRMVKVVTLPVEKTP